MTLFRIEIGQLATLTQDCPSTFYCMHAAFLPSYSRFICVYFTFLDWACTGNHYVVTDKEKDNSDKKVIINICLIKVISYFEPLLCIEIVAFTNFIATVTLSYILIWSSRSMKYNVCDLFNYSFCKFLSVAFYAVCIS